eukprot:sb/3474022/
MKKSPDMNTRAFKSGLGTLCKVGPERPRMEKFLVTLATQLLNNNYLDEAKMWIDYLNLVDNPHGYELKTRYRSMKGIGSKSGGLKVNHQNEYHNGGEKVKNSFLTNQNSLFRSRDWLSANQGPAFTDSVGPWLLAFSTSSALN